MLTLRFDRLGLQPGDMFLDAGAGFGRHAYEAARQGATVFALDYAQEEVTTTRATFAAMSAAKEISADQFGGALRGDATKLPFADNTFDCVVTSEVLEHIQDDVMAISELVRVLKPGGSLGVTVPTWWPEKVNWMLSEQYHAPISKGGHVRIYSATELKAKLRSAGLTVRGSHHAHALHSPYWWLRCAVGPTNDTNRAVATYKRFLEWDIIKAPKSTRLADRLLNPLLGKSYVVYSTKKIDAQVGATS
ncbi:MAG: class I SAM-dependent methyltransferase [Ilumatobacteraceae bacterium]|nr:class I SAM-dependent methyltransferase [Ilumatobacteraceae bacterium]